MDQHPFVRTATSETKAGRVNPGAMALEMWAKQWVALTKTLSLLLYTRVTRPNWPKWSLMATSNKVALTPVRWIVVTVVWRPAIDEGAAAGGPRDARGGAFQILFVLIGGEESQPQQLGFRLWPNIEEFVKRKTEIFKEKVIPLFKSD